MSKVVSAPSHFITHLWQAWGAAATTFFLVLEIFTLCTNWQNTLSANIWRALKVKPHEAIDQHTALWFLSLGGYITLVTWLAFHFWFELFRS